MYNSVDSSKKQAASGAADKASCTVNPFGPTRNKVATAAPAGATNQIPGIVHTDPVTQVPALELVPITPKVGGETLLSGEAAPSKPQAPITPDNIPKVMKDMHCWTVWEDIDGRKIPFNARDTTQKASSTNMNTWSTFSMAMAALEHAGPFRPLSGLQYALTAGWIGIDLDDCIGEDGVTLPWAQDIIDRLNSYTEISPSGKGYKIWILGTHPLKTHRKKQTTGEVEVYSAGKLFTVTTNHLPGTPNDVLDRTGEFASVYADYLYREGEDIVRVSQESTITLADQEIITKIRASKDGPAFAKLYDHGDISDYNGASEADFDLARIFCFYVGDDEVERVKKLMWSSELERDKWTKNKSYLDLTISKQMGGEKWSPGGYKSGLRTITRKPNYEVHPAPAASPAATAPASPPPAFATVIPPAPPGGSFGPGAFEHKDLDPIIMPSGESKADAVMITKMLADPLNITPFYNTSPELVQRLTQLLYTLNDKMAPALAYFSAMALINGALGKRISIINKGHELYPSFWFVGLSPTGTGKSCMLKAKRAITDELRRREYRTPSKFMSDKFTMSSLFSEYGESVGDAAWNVLNDHQQALKLDEMEQRCIRKMGRVMVSDEFGHYLGTILRSGVEGGENGSILKLADSGATINGDTKSSGKRLIADACVSVVGFSQPSVWQDNFDPDKNIESGLAGRFLMASYDAYTLDIHPLELTFQQTMDGIKTVIRELLDKTVGIADRVVCEAPNPDDERGRIFEELLTGPEMAAIVKHGFLDVAKLKGKLIMLALKLTESHCFMQATPELLRTFSGSPVPDGAPARALPAHAHSLGETIEPDEHLAPMTKAVTVQLYDSDVFKNYLNLVLWTAARAYNTRHTESDVEKLQAKVLKKLMMAKDHRMLVSRVLNLGLKFGQRRLTATDIDQYVIGPLVEQGKIAVREGARKARIMQWTPQGEEAA